METSLRESERGEIICEHRIPLQSRLIIGSMLGFLASFFLYYLVTGLIEYIRDATLALWLSALPGLVVVLALFLLFAVPAWIAVAGRTRVVVDLQSGRILDVRDLRVHRRTTTVPIDSVLGVSVSRQRRSFRIQIDLSGRKPITVGYEPNAREARDVAERLAGHLRTEVSS